MVNPVNNISNDYLPSVGKTVKVNNEEHFSLDSAVSEQSRHEGVVYEQSEEAQKDTGSSSSSSSSSGSSTTDRKRKDSFESTLDNAIKKQDKNAAYDSAFRESVKELWHGISNFFSNLWKNVRKIFGNVWDSKPISEGVDMNIRNSFDTQSSNNASENKPKDSSDIMSSDSSIDSYEADRDAKIRQALSEGNRDEFRTLLSEDGKRIPAHNTTMITTYNARGKLVDIDPSDENKILHGDRKTMKL